VLANFKDYSKTLNKAYLNKYNKKYGVNPMISNSKPVENIQSKKQDSNDAKLKHTMVNK